MLSKSFGNLTQKICIGFGRFDMSVLTSTTVDMILFRLVLFK